jgi:ABC-type uncharacterized transport system substrate-binding protein
VAVQHRIFRKHAIDAAAKRPVPGAEKVWWREFRLGAVAAGCVLRLKSGNMKTGIRAGPDKAAQTAATIRPAHHARWRCRCRAEGPGGNATGISVQSPELAGKRIEILREALPNLRRLAIIGDVSYAGSVLEISEVKAAAGKFSLDIDVLEISRPADIAPAFQALKGGTQALYVCPSALVNATHARINTFALGARLPAFHASRDFLGAGGFMSYGANYSDQFRHAGDFVDKILKGTKPADLPVEQPTKFELVINLTTIKALGLTIPETFLARADEVIE